MSYYVGAASCGVGESATLHPGVLESRHRIDCIEEAQKPNGFDGTAERLAKRAHEFQKL